MLVRLITNEVVADAVDLKLQPNTELYLPIRKAIGRTDRAESVVDVRIVPVSIRRRQLRRIEDIEKLGPELCLEAFIDCKVFRQSQIQLIRRRTAQAVPLQGSKRSGSGRGESRTVKVVISRAVAVRITRNIHSYSVEPNVERLPALRSPDSIQLPSTDDRINDGINVGTPAASAAERDVPYRFEREHVREINA